MVIRIGAGEVGSSVSQLAKDFRLMMEPDTASRLKERRANRLRDYTTMAGPLGVTHLILFSRSRNGNTNLRFAVTPRGPTLHFRVENYSLNKDVEKALKHPRGGGQDHRTPPLLVMNNFYAPNATEKTRIPKQLESLATTVFQSLFPPISPQTTPLKSIRRVMLLNREMKSPESAADKEPYILNLRHYAITTRKTGIRKRIRRLDPKEQRHKDKKHALPNLGKLEDVADYLVGPSAAEYTSASETELDTDAEVEVAESTTRKVLNRRELQRMKAAGKVPSKPETPNVEKRAVKLVELGPRLKLRLIKVEEGLCSGRIMWHDHIHKSEKEVKELDETWNRRRKEKEERKRQQKENIERKKKEKEQARANGQEVSETEDEDEEMDDDEWDSDELDEEADVQHDDEESGESSAEDSDVSMDG